MGLNIWIETMGDYAETFICPNCRGGSMRKRNGFSSCPSCGHKIMNLEEDKSNGEKERKKRSVKTMTRNKL